MNSCSNSGSCAASSSGVAGTEVLPRRPEPGLSQAVERELQDIEINNDGWRKWYFSMNRQDDTATSRVNAKNNPTENWKLHGYKKASALDTKLLGNKTVRNIASSKNLIPEMGTVMSRSTPETAGTVAQTSKQILKTADLIPGGMADKAHKKPSDFDPKQIAMGMKVEKEHTPDPKKRKEIAMDHLTEFPKYYTALDKMEKSMKKKAFIKTAISLTRLQQAGIATSERLRALPHEAPERQRLTNFSNKLYDAVTSKHQEIDKKVLQARAEGASWVPNRFKMK